MPQLQGATHTEQARATAVMGWVKVKRVYGVSIDLILPSFALRLIKETQFLIPFWLLTEQAQSYLTLKC